MASTLLREIFDLGENMLTALKNEELDRYFELLDERGTLLEGLKAYRHPSEIDENWQETADALAEQQDALLTAARDQELRMQDSLTKLEQLKDAHRSYHQPPQRANILNENLRV